MNEFELVWFCFLDFDVINRNQDQVWTGEILSPLCDTWGQRQQKLIPVIVVHNKYNLNNEPIKIRMHDYYLRTCFCTTMNNFITEPKQTKISNLSPYRLTLEPNQSQSVKNGSDFNPL